MDNQPRFIIHRFLLWLLLVPLAVLFPLMIMFLPGAVFEPFWARALLFLVICSIDALLLKRLFPTKSWVEVSLAAGLINGVVYRLAVYLPDISTYPLSLDWSETSRYYYA